MRDAGAAPQSGVDGGTRAKYGRIWSVLSSVSFGVVSRKHHDSFCILRVGGGNSVRITSGIGGASIRVVTERVLVDFRAIGVNGGVNGGERRGPTHPTVLISALGES